MHRHKVQLAYLFGSVLDDAAGPLSDLDIAILPDPETYHWLNTYSDIYDDLCALFGADNIDVAMLHEAPLSLQFSVLQTGWLIYADNDDAATHWTERVLALYNDTAAWRAENWHYACRIARQGIAKEFFMIKKERVERFIFIIRDAVQELEQPAHSTPDFDTYYADKTTRALSEHYLRRAIEATIDLGRHVIVATGLGVPQEYKEVAKTLRDKGVVPYSLGDELIALASMRNVLVHLYWDIDYWRIYEVIANKLPVFEETIRHILAYITAQEAVAGEGEADVREE
ncbi:MAG: DUF86 domain-containing protein [Anaerolineae bacterium]|nr:DUF86 domain-containing protein [Anaerolineae bacterium]